MGPPGHDGADGNDGAVGAPGAPGLAGPTGATGPTGPTGATGATGQMGPPGNDGADGNDGAVGAPGAIGLTGPTGPTGPTGARGQMGPPGNDGAEGPEGPQGPSGAVGGWPAVLRANRTTGLTNPRIDTGQHLQVGNGTPTATGQIASADTLDIASDSDVRLIATAEAICNGVAGASFTSCTAPVGGIGTGDVLVAARGGVLIQAGSDTPGVSATTGDVDVVGSNIIRFVPGVSVNIEGAAPFFSMFEAAASTPSMITGQSLYWTRNDALQSPMFTDDGNVDHDLLAGRLIAITAYTAGTGATHNFNARTTFVLVDLQGGGAGGYGCAAAAASQCIACSGGGAGAFQIARYTLSSPGGSGTYTVGAGGAAGGAASPSDPGDGGDTTFTIGADVATAGGASAASATAMASGTAAIASAQLSFGGFPSVTGGWTSIRACDGHPGQIGIRLQGLSGIGGAGGAAGSGSTGGGPRATAGTGLNPPTGSTGAGGGGALTLSAVARAGGVGRGGYIIVYEYEF